MQGFCNNIYDNAPNIIGWDPNESKKNVDRNTVVTAGVGGVGTGGGSMLEGKVNMVQGTYLTTPSNL